MNREAFWGIILAAGASSRMGRLKWQVEIGGKSFLERALDCFSRAGIVDIYAVFREGEIPPGNFTVLINPQPERGQLSSLKTALERIEPGRPFIMQLVDRPLVSWKTIGAMLEAYDGQIIIPVYESRKGHPVVFPPDMREIILKTDDTLGIRGAIAAWTGEVKLLNADDEAVLWNIDTAEALEQYSRRM